MSNRAFILCLMIFILLKLIKTESTRVLVNGMVLHLVPGLSGEYNQTSVYEYADGDVVDVMCTNFGRGGVLTMNYSYADSLINAYSSDISSSSGVGFRATLHCEHNNTYMTCADNNITNYKVVVRFVMRTKFNNIIIVSVNGSVLRPQHKEGQNVINYEIQYNNYMDKEDVVCKVNGGGHYKFKVTSEQKYPGPNKDMFTNCTATNENDKAVETIFINTTTKIGELTDPSPLHMNLSSSVGAAVPVLELYGISKLKVIYYEYEDGEILKLKCHIKRDPILNTYVEFKDDDLYSPSEVSITLNLTSAYNNSSQRCYMRANNNTLLREIRIIFIEKKIPLNDNTCVNRDQKQRKTNVTRSDITSPQPNDAYNVHITSAVVLIIPIITFYI